MPLFPKDLIKRKQTKDAIVILTAFDYLTAYAIEQSGIDVILVGDSLGNVFAGYDSTHPVRVKDIIYHTQAVKRGAPHSLIIADMPFLSTQISLEQSKSNAGALIQDGGAQAVKIEIFSETDLKTTEAILQMGIPVIGHLGLTPQSVYQLGGYQKQAKSDQDQALLLKRAQQLEAMGCFALVLECIPASLAKQCQTQCQIPVIGIGSGPDCDGQILVTHDLLGLTPGKPPSFVTPYANLSQEIHTQLTAFKNDVLNQTFPKS